MNYSVVPLNGGSQFDLNGVRFRDKSFMFWKKRNVQAITEVVVVFDKQYENVPVSDNVIILSLKSLTSVNEMKEAIQIFQQIINNNQILFRFVVGNENEIKIAEMLGNELGLSYVLQNMNQKKKTMEEELKERNMQVGNGQMIEKHEHGQIKQITVQDGALYENNGLLNSEEEKVSLLREWMQDPRKAAELSRMSVEARDELLTQAVMGKRRAYNLEPSSVQVANDKVAEAAVNKASAEDGLVNTELGIVQNNVSNPNQYSAIEEHGDDIKIVNSDVKRSQISANGVSYGTSLGEHMDTNLNHEKEQSREMVENQVFYISPQGEIYDKASKMVGFLGQGYSMDYNDNTLLKEGKKIGSIGDYKDMGKEKNNVYAKPKVRTLEKDNQDKSAAFVSLPVIIFILSALLLIVSSVLLFIVD